MIINPAIGLVSIGLLASLGSAVTGSWQDKFWTHPDGTKFHYLEWGTGTPAWGAELPARDPPEPRPPLVLHRRHHAGALS